MSVDHDHQRLLALAEELGCELDVLPMMDGGIEVTLTHLSGRSATATIDRNEIVAGTSYDEALEQVVRALAKRVADDLRPLDRTGRAVAFRVWRIDGDDRLMSLGDGHTRWIPGPQKATCKKGSHPGAPAKASLARRILGALPDPIPPAEHRPAEPGCDCGWYGLHDLLDAAGGAMSGHGTIVGAIAAWGRTQVHAAGIRAEWAEIVALSAPEHLQLIDRGYGERAARVAADYGVPLLSLPGLQDTAEEFGEPVPKDLRPAGDGHYFSTAWGPAGLSSMARAASSAQRAGMAYAGVSRSMMQVATGAPRFVGGASGMAHHQPDVHNHHHHHYHPGGPPGP